MPNWNTEALRVVGRAESELSEAHRGAFFCYADPIRVLVSR